MRYYILGFTLALLGNIAAKSQDYARLMEQHGLVDVRSLNPNIRVELKYSSTDNFIGEDMYGTLDVCYLEKGFAKRVAQAQNELSRLCPGYALLIYDGARPMSIQRRMYAKVAHTEKRIYVAPATKGGRHNYGVAVDLTIVNSQGKVLDMGSPFDHFGEEAHLENEDTLIKTKKIKAEAKKNRALLQRVMRAAGMRPYDKEWWHYQELIPMTTVRQRYKRLDF